MHLSAWLEEDRPTLYFDGSSLSCCSSSTIALQVDDEKLRPSDELLDSLPPYWQQVIKPCLAMVPGERYTAQEVYNLLKQVTPMQQQLPAPGETVLRLLLLLLLEQ